ncbi:PepSY domain-containing protein [Candidatus Woesearchaeota archaeon]|nr:PepSY domain-containing protein [Candidatus Woesearchaeota archaeon]
MILATGVFIASAVTSQKSQEDDDDENEAAITGSALEEASAAALNYIGQGRVTETEVGDEEGYYEVEITLDNGQQVDVHLDENFNVLGHESDSDEEDD